MDYSRSSPVLYLISPPSAGEWFRYFAVLTAEDRVQEIGEGPDIDEPAVRRELTAGLATRMRHVVMLSSHDTLLRDVLLAERLRADGIAVMGQSQACARVGYDKFAMKRFFDAHDLGTARWGDASEMSSITPGGTPVVVKNRHGTQSAGTRLSTAAHCALRGDEFAEVFVDGVEYSVVVFRDGLGLATFPPVWKGRTSPDLVPPWRRLRLCPDPGIDATLDRRLRAVAAKVVVLADGVGHSEVELVVDDVGDIHLLEINPRVSGTMRISAMATCIPIFSMHRLPEARGTLAAVRSAAEAPYSGPVICDPDRDMFATSRLTVAAGTHALAIAKLDDMVTRTAPSAHRP
jgi:carbamoylphosphate synthase large subunit